MPICSDTLQLIIVYLDVFTLMDIAMEARDPWFVKHAINELERRKIIYI